MINALQGLLGAVLQVQDDGVCVFCASHTDLFCAMYPIKTNGISHFDLFLWLSAVKVSGTLNLTNTTQTDTRLVLNFPMI